MNTLIREVNELVLLWAPRVAQMQKWYRMIRLHNNLAQARMESVIASDPRTGFNMALWLLLPRVSSFYVVNENLTASQVQHCKVIEAYCDEQLRQAIRASRRTLYGAIDRRILSLMLATGWYSVISYPTESGWQWGVWNPAGVYPDYDADGLLRRVARKYTIASHDAMRKIAEEGWLPPQRPFPERGTMTMYQLWKRTSEGVTFQAAIDQHLAQPEKETEFSDIPVFVGPVAGLPDDGSIIPDQQWRAEIGQSVLAPIVDVMENYNRMLTFMQQLVRDTANPRWVEKVRKPVLDADKLFERGAIFSIEPGEDIFPIPTPPIPAEARTHLFDLRGQIQRGLFSDISFGNLTQQISGWLMTQVTAAAKQVLDPFYRGYVNLMSEIATANIAAMRERKLLLNGEPFPRLPDLELGYRYEIEIPGDLMQRANAAKIINPQFKLSALTLMNVLFPEVKSAISEMGRIDSEDARQNPIFRQVVLIQRLMQAAQEARANKDGEYARLLEQAASMVQQSFEAPQGVSNDLTAQ